MEMDSRDAKEADSGRQQMSEPSCPECDEAAKGAYSDATTAGFFYSKCEKHRSEPSREPGRMEPSEEAIAAATTAHKSAWRKGSGHFNLGEILKAAYAIDFHAHQQAMQGLERWIRERVWFSHGCTGLYGDDGEMQCNNIQRHGAPLDFKRMPMEQVFEVDARCRLDAAAPAQDEEAKLLHRLVKEGVITSSETGDTRARLLTFLESLDAHQQAMREAPIVEELPDGVRIRTEDTAWSYYMHVAVHKQAMQGLEARVKELEAQLANAQQR